jgi:hypothetical protein
MSNLWDSVPTSFKSRQYPIKVVRTLQPHIEALQQALTSDLSKPLRWFDFKQLEELLPLTDHAVYTILVDDQVAGFFYLKKWDGLPRNGLEMAYCLIKAFRGRGILELTLVTILSQLFGIRLPDGENLEVVCAFVERTNLSSSKAHQRMGMDRLLPDGKDLTNPESNVFYENYQFSEENWGTVAPMLEERGSQKFR